MIGFGFVVARFGLFLREIADVGSISRPPHTGVSLCIGTALVLVGVVVCLLAAGEHFRFLRRLDQRLPYRAPKRSLGIIVAIVLGALGFIMAAYLVFFGRSG
jgi:putative membrane protein